MLIFRYNDAQDKFFVFVGCWCSHFHNGSHSTQGLSAITAHLIRISSAHALSSGFILPPAPLPPNSGAG
jgi:hypothetical protein